MRWIIVILSMNASGHPFIQNSSWMDQPGYLSLEACEEDVPRQKALHPDSTVSALGMSCSGFHPVENVGPQCCRQPAVGGVVQ